jgi:hypothetical protein
MAYLGNADLPNGGHDLLSALIEASANTTIVAASAGKRIRVYAVKVVAGTMATTSWTDTALVPLEGTQVLPGTGGYAESVDPPSFLLSTVIGRGLRIVTDAQVGGRVSYWIE